MRWLRRLGPLGPLAGFAVVVPPISGVLLLGTLHKVGPWLREHDALGLLLYVSAFVVLGGLALLPTYAQSVLGGWAFGFPVGMVAVLIGFSGAALVSYVVAGRVSGDRLERLLAENPRWHGVYRLLLRSGFGQALVILTLVRLPPNAPFAATNVALSAMRAPVLPFMIGTVAGLAPRAGVVVYAGAGLSTLDFSNRTQTGWFLVGLAITIAVVVVLGLLANRALARVDASLGQAKAASGKAVGRAVPGARSGNHRPMNLSDRVPEQGESRPPDLPRELVLFDGECGLCQRSVRFLARVDRSGRFWFAPLQGQTAARALARHPRTRGVVRDAVRPNTIVFVSACDVYTKSDAALRIALRLGWPWRALGALMLVPRSLRDLVYDVVARHRRQWFGSAESCGLPPAALRARLLE